MCLALTPAQEAALLAPFQAAAAAARAKMDAVTTNLVRWNLARADYSEACDTLAAARRSLWGPGEEAVRAHNEALANEEHYFNS